MSLREEYSGAAIYRLDIPCLKLINTKPVAFQGKSETDPGEVKKKISSEFKTFHINILNKWKTVSLRE